MGKPVILAVDDDASVLEAVIQDLRRKYGAGYRILRAGSGQAALDTCTQLQSAAMRWRFFSPTSACRA
jgi:thioredoxin reductase (NADPH)